MRAKTQEEALQKQLSYMLMGDSSEVYSDKAMALAYEPMNVGRISDPHGEAEITGNCGDTFSISFRLKNDKISETGFLTDGCGATLACGSALTEMLKGKSLYEARKLQPQHILDYLDGLPASHVHCAVLAIQTLKKALK